MDSKLLAQYEGSSVTGEVLGESTSAGIPTYYLRWILLLLFLGFVILFIFLRLRRRS